MDLIDIALYLSYALGVLAGLAAIAFPIINSVGNPDALKKSGIGIAALLVLFLLSYLISGDEVTAVYTQFNVDSGLSQWIGGVLTLMYILIIGAVVGIVYTESSKLLKK